MRLRISRKKRRMVRVLLYGGLAAMLLFCLLISIIPRGFALAGLLASLAAGVAGALRADQLYRCPQCGRGLLTRNGLLFLNTYNHCPDCGWEVTIEWTE